MKDLEIFKNSEFGEVKVIVINGDKWFVAKEIAESLGYSNARDAVARHCMGVVKRDVPHHQSKGN